MSSNTYIKVRGDMTPTFKLLAEKTMADGAADERKKAIANGRFIMHRGVKLGLITVTVDGQWGTRSYNNSGFDATSGSAVIVGNETGKVLFTAVRNKLCSICDFYARKNLPCRPHVCYKNFDRNVSSTIMESDIIAEGFNCSIEMHGLIYQVVVGDNDASVHATILNNNPYAEFNIEVEKVDCTNHLFRNMCKKIKTLAKTSDPNFLRNREFCYLRKLILSKSMQIKNEVDKARIRRQNEKENQTEKAKNLSDDLTFIIDHVFGKHHDCQSRGFDCVAKTEEMTNYISKLKHFGLYDRILEIMNYLGRSAESLLLHMLNNVAELFNSVICKTIEGKRILFGRKDSYVARIYAAVVQFNTQEALTELNKFLDCTEYDIAEEVGKQR